MLPVWFTGFTSPVLLVGPFLARQAAVLTRGAGSTPSSSEGITWSNLLLSMCQLSPPDGKT